MFAAAGWSFMAVARSPVEPSCVCLSVDMCKRPSRGARSGKSTYTLMLLVDSADPAT